MNKDEWDRITLRLPPALNMSLKRVARKTRRSLNSEIIKRLSDSLNMTEDSDAENALTVKESAEKISDLARKIALLSENTAPSKTDLLNPKELNLVKWFNEASISEQELLMNSLPELLSLLKKLS